MSQTNTCTLSRHAQRRCQQRGITRQVLWILLDHHDLDRDVGGNCRVLRMSRKRARVTSLDFDPQIAGRLERLAVIMSDETGEIVTVMHDTAKSRRYRASA